MRTTLKRGIGRAGGPNGNGHSALPPLFGPVARYRQPQPPRRSVVGLILRAFGWLVLACAVLGSGVAGGYYLYLHRAVTELKAQKGSDVAKAKTRLHVIASPSQPAIALIAGYDHRAGTGKSLVGSNSDTLMLVRANPQNHTLSLLSVPRDLWVPIYCHGNIPTTTSRINSAWSICGANGPTATLDTMEHLTHLPINYLITLDFHAFKQLVNRLHGIYMNVDRRYYIAPHTGTSQINLQPGYQKLDGGQALSYVRYRHTDSDIYRTGRQQLFIEALKARLRTQLSLATLPFELPKLIGVLKGNLEYVKAGGGTVSFNELESYLGIAYHLPPGHLVRNQIPIQDFHFFTTPAGADVETAPQSAIAGAVHRFLHPNLRASHQVSAQFFGAPKARHTKKKHLLPKSKVTVLVLNGGAAAGEALNTSYLLSQHGFATKSLPASMPANAPTKQHDTVVYWNEVEPNAKAAAQELRPLFGSHTRIQQFTTGIRSFAARAGNPLAVVSLGSSYTGTLRFPHKMKPRRRTPPQVSPGGSVTVPALRRVRGGAHFQLMVPQRIAQFAQLSSDEGVRVFKPLEHQHEVVLTFVMPNGIQYWQVEETTWTSAPILENPTGQFVFRHRKYLLYTTGGAIQMVAVRAHGAVYWVTNTLLNQLSNSTMIAIAESLRPLGR
jgi:LCP family protein required for cell wall assembly